MITDIKKFLLDKIDVPSEYINDYYREAIKSNYLLLSILAVILIIYQGFLLSIKSLLPAFKHWNLLIYYMIFNAVFLPVSIYLHNHSQTVKLKYAKTVSYIYRVCVILFYIVLSLLLQGVFDMVHFYVMALFGLTVIIYIKPRDCLIILASTYLLFAIALPYFQSNPEVVLILRINTFMANLIAFICCVVVVKFRISIYCQKKLLNDKAAELERLVRHDQMTGLLNHDSSLSELETELSFAKQNDYPVSLIFADIDNLKLINDTYGHLAGDDAIRLIADVIKNSVRAEDKVGRFGGDEFIIILPFANLETAKKLCERIHNNIEAAKLPGGIQVSISCGINQFNNESLYDFINGTDKILYTNKRKSIVE